LVARSQHPNTRRLLAAVVVAVCSIMSTTGGWCGLLPVDAGVKGLMHSPLFFAARHSRRKKVMEGGHQGGCPAGSWFVLCSICLSKNTLDCCLLQGRPATPRRPQPSVSLLYPPGFIPSRLLHSSKQQGGVLCSCNICRCMRRPALPLCCSCGRCALQPPSLALLFLSWSITTTSPSDKNTTTRKQGAEKAHQQSDWPLAARNHRQGSAST